MTLYAERAHQTRWLIEWLLRNPELHDLVEEIRRIHAAHPDRLPADLATRGCILKHLGAIPLPAGARMEFLVHGITTTLGLVHWDEVHRAIAHRRPA